ncbi:MerR family transcriptional regulator [Streptomyces adustus]|uniref:MerR family transcriptional regulator n=1 Tax=Streptomyces adustus TaxID=1609272 RepID=A0A5N8VIZ0_9ACTN|nr:MerR family transcriptional regulator [Streptomyces adustus]MPY34064.1 MerR family transcriptional regulator [Streptomyces adustus]
MRIGEIAALVGVTPRTVRHYHHQGLLPEPARLGNGYRHYGLREAVLLARIRRLAELGLALEEVRDILADDQGRELVEVLEKLDDDLARQQALLQDRRTRLHVLLVEARAGRVAADGPLSPELTRLLAGLGPVTDSPTAAKDRDHLVFLDNVLPQEQRTGLLAALDGMRDHAERFYALLDGLADSRPDDPEVARAAEGLAELIPDALAAYFPVSDEGAVQAALFADLAPGQAAALRLAMRLATGRKEGRA